MDYEAGETLTIRVQARDEYNATVEGNYTVTLIDVFEDLDGDGIEDLLDDDMDGDGYTNVENLPIPPTPVIRIRHLMSLLSILIRPHH